MNLNPRITKVAIGGEFKPDMFFGPIPGPVTLDFQRVKVGEFDQATEKLAKVDPVALAGGRPIYATFDSDVIFGWREPSMSTGEMYAVTVREGG